MPKYDDVQGCPNSLLIIPAEDAPPTASIVRQHEPSERARQIMATICNHVNVDMSTINEVKLSKRNKRVRAAIAFRLYQSGFQAPEIASLLQRSEVCIYQLITYASENSAVAALGFPGTKPDCINQMLLYRQRRAIEKSFVELLKPKDTACVKVIEAFLTTLPGGYVNLLGMHKTPGQRFDPLQQVRIHAAMHAYKNRCEVGSIARVLGLSYKTAKKYATGRF